MPLYLGSQSIKSNFSKLYVGSNLVWSLSIPLPALGTFWEGGYYIGNITDAGTDYALVLGPKNLGEQNGYQFTGAGTLYGTPSLTDGFGNTQKLANAINLNVFTWARNLNINGKTDWYIPARGEWNVIGANKASIPSSEYFAWNYYWTSNEFSAANAWEYVVSNGNHENYGKDSASASRVIRRVPINS